ADPYSAVGADGDVDDVGMSGHRLIDRVVHHLVSQVVQSPFPGGADIHPGALADRLQALQDGDVGCTVRRACRVGTIRGRNIVLWFRHTRLVSHSSWDSSSHHLVRVAPQNLPVGNLHGPHHG